MVLGAEGAPAVPELIKIVQDPKRRTQSRLLAMDWLQWIGEPARAALPSLRGLELDTNAQIRAAGAAVSWVIKGTNAVNAIGRGSAWE